MSKQIHREGQRKKQVKFRVGEDIVDEFDDWCDDRDLSRSEALRSHMKACLSGQQEYDTPRMPPTDDDQLATAYRRLCAVANSDGIVSTELATSVLASALGISKSETKPVALRPLDERGYINWESNVYGHAVYKIAGWPK